MSLRGKLVAFIIGAVALIQLFWGLSVVQSNAALMEREAHRRSRAILHAIAAPAALHLATREFETIDAILDVYEKRSTGELAFRAIAVLDINGEVVAHTDPRQYGTTMDSTFVVNALNTRRSLTQHIQTERGRVAQVSMPIISGLRWGTIIAETSLGGLDDRVVSNQITVLISTLLIAFSTAILIWALLNKMVFTPLEAFARTSRAIGAGDFSARSNVPKTKDELELLGNTINEMAERVETHAGHLEATVTARTSALQDANTALAKVNRDLATAVDELARLARTDGLTQLNNHRTFQERIVEEVRRSERSKFPLTLLMIDVDHFKAYNDTHGHPAGDRVLIRVAELMTSVLRNTDVVARYGGEEFAILLVDTPLSFAAQVGDKVRTAIRSEIFEGADRSQPAGRVTVSIGMAGWPVHGKTAAALIDSADQALYQAKHAGRDQVKMCEDLSL
jgi:diguanylate cyclase (GGDEF)-like protein